MSKPKKKPIEEASLKDLILNEYGKGNVVHNTIEGPAIVEFNNFFEQPIEGVLYDLNIAEEVVLSGIDEDSTTWINDYARCKTIRTLLEKNQQMLETLNKLISMNTCTGKDPIVCQECTANQENNCPTMLAAKTVVNVTNKTLEDLIID